MSVVEEDLKLLQLKLRASLSIKCDLEGRSPNTGKIQNHTGKREQLPVLTFLTPSLRHSPSSRALVHTHSLGVVSFTDQIKKLEDDRQSLQSARAVLEDENKTLKQKVEILNELYQQKEMALQK